MKKTKLKDIIIGCLLLSSLSVATFIVSCSDEEGSVVSSVATRHNYHQHVKGELIVSGLAAVFGNVGVGAANDVGYMTVGWALSSIGLCSHSGVNWSKQLSIIDDDLDSMITLLNTADDELESIDSILNVLNCTFQQTSLQSDLAAIQTEYDAYNAFLLTASQGDTIPNVFMESFANDVINGNGSQPSIIDALSNIQVNINEESGVIVSCLQPIPAPAANTFGQDAVYYDQAQGLLNYYYYYQTIGMALISEAYHYNAWVLAGGPGDTTYSADSVQMVCSETGSSLECNNVIVDMNTLYNSLLTQFGFVGAPYTDGNLLYQNSSNGQQIVWVVSLEDFTSQSGSSCNYPLNTSNLCGPTAGLFDQALTTTSYYGTSNLEFASLSQFNDLTYNLSTIEGYSSIGDYMESLGFENMSGKILITDSLVFLYDSDYSDWFDTMSVVPFISVSDGVYTNTGGQKRALYSGLDDFKHLMGSSPSSVTNTGQNCDNTLTSVLYKVTWSNTSPGAGQWDYLLGAAEYCNYYQEDLPYSPLTWTAPDGAPGWSYNLPNASPQKAFLMPVRTDFSGNTGCVAGYTNLNSGGVITKCGTDFQDYLTINLPKPPTCNVSNVNPPCN